MSGEPKQKKKNDADFAKLNNYRSLSVRFDLVKLYRKPLNDSMGGGQKLILINIFFILKGWISLKVFVN